MKFVILFSWLVFMPCYGQKVETLSLSRALKLASVHSFKLKQFDKQLIGKQKSIEKIIAQYRPKLDILVGLGPINKAYGDALQSSDADPIEFKSWGLLAMATVEAKIPLYTWGQKENYLDAAKLGKQVEEQEKIKEKNSLHYKIKEIYYGILLANSVLDFLAGVEEDMDKAIKELKKNRRKNKQNLYQLNIFKYQLIGKRGEIEAQKEMAYRALRYYTGIDGEIALVDEWLEFDRKKVRDFAYYRDKFFANRPELKQVAAGIKAKYLLAKAAYKDRFPMLGVIGKYDFSYTSARQKQESVFAYDPYNKNSLIVGVGFTWKLDWGVSKLKSEGYKIERQVLQLKEQEARKGLLLDLKRKWKKVDTMYQLVKNNSKARKYAKKWLNSIVMKAGIGGKLNIENFAKAYQARVMTYKTYLESLYQYYLAWASLSEAVGVEVDPRLSE